MLMQMPLPAYVGDTPPMGNVGKMENSGIEMDLSYRFQVSDLNVKFGANASYLKNKLIEYIKGQYKQSWLRIRETL